jgi:hypothetical protein
MAAFRSVSSDRSRFSIGQGLGEIHSLRPDFHTARLRELRGRSGVLEGLVVRLRKQTIQGDQRAFAIRGRGSSQKLNVDQVSAGSECAARINQVQGPAGVELHRNEVLSAHNTQRHTMEGHFDYSRERGRVEAAKPGKQIHAVAIGIAQGEDRSNRIISISESPSRR